MSDEYDKLIHKIYPIKMELEECEFIQPKLLEIVNFYYERYGSHRIDKPKKSYKFEKDYNLLIERMDELKLIKKKLQEKIDAINTKEVKK
ncbi:MAG: hypothetical protein ACP6IY_09485 [Promethearchaeia archaeon]